MGQTTKWTGSSLMLMPLSAKLLTESVVGKADLELLESYKRIHSGGDLIIGLPCPCPSYLARVRLPFDPLRSSTKYNVDVVYISPSLGDVLAN